MERLRNHWPRYHEATKERPPRELLADAMKFVATKHAALDFGAGALTDSKFLLREGFEKVVAVDGEPTIHTAAEKIADERLEVVISEFESFPFPTEEFDLVNAQFSLPFVRPESFVEVFEKMKHSLKEGGIFAGQLFGTRDDWHTNNAMTFHTADEVQHLLSDMNVIECREVEKDDTAADGSIKHWHVFHIIAKK